MNRVLLAAAIGAALLLASRRSNAAQVFEPLQFDSSFDVPQIHDFNLELDPVNEFQVSAGAVGAMLHLIKTAEHSAATSDADKYQTFFGGARFFDMRDHPVETGEMAGVRLSDAMCRDAGFSPGCVSTAAGAYQIIRPTWNRIRAAGRYGPRLQDFSPASQDEAAIRLLKESGAYDLLLIGDIDSAILRAGRLWASLPGSTANQNPRSLAVARSIFQQGYFA